MYYIFEFLLFFIIVFIIVIDNIICNNLKEKKEVNFYFEFLIVYQYVYKFKGIIIDKLYVL